MNSNDLRKAYLDFFKNRNHRVVPSDSLIPIDDPSLLFTGAGMNQFKKQFMGQITDYKRATSAQKCLRTDDLDKVGKTASHHTFFEMLGNFSFGDYFKKEAITWAWEFLTQVLKINPDYLWVSVYNDDQEAYSVWEKVVKVPRHKIIKLGAKDNFWPANAILDGPNGPCGPCSEIFFDWGKEVGCKKDDCAPGCDCGRFVEIWNLVFTQFNRKGAFDKKDGILEQLPNKNIDTGMGLERMASVLQGVKSNFDIDIFKTIKKAILSLELKNKNEELINIISDHIRAITFTISDGVMPSNEERGYVLRKIIRKSFLHGRALGLNKPFLYKLVPSVTEAMKEPYPELINNREDIANVILSEEKSFLSILDSTDQICKEKFYKDIDSEKAGVIAFQLYDTHGIPLDSTSAWASEHNIKISFLSFNKELDKQKERSKKSSKIQGSIFDSEAILLKGVKSKFLGY
ncbi:MAG: alanine--tRNA ligase, partial [Candidatus Omnitrophota bacterium]